MTRITVILATVLSLAFTPLAAQETNCDGWMASNWEVQVQFWETATSATVSDCLNSGSSVNARGEIDITPLHLAALLNENPEVFTVLLDAGADVNARDKDGRTPLLIAARPNYPEVFTVLLDAGADVNARDEDGDTPLHQAAGGNENPEVIIELLDAGADVNARNKDGETPLFFAARLSCLWIQKL